MQLNLDGRVISNQPNKTLIEQTIISMTGDAILTLQDDQHGFIQTVGSRSKGFIMTGQDSKGKRQLDQLDPVGTADVILAFTAFLNGTEAWKQQGPAVKAMPKNKSGQMSGKSIFTVMIIIFVVVIGMVGFGMFMTARSGGNVATSEVAQFVPIVAAVAIYFGWLFFLFSWFRPRLAGFLTRMLNTVVSEDTISGGLQAEGALWKRFLIIIIEAIVFIPGALFPLVVIGFILLQ